MPVANPTITLSPGASPCRQTFSAGRSVGIPQIPRCFPNPPSAHSQIHWEEQQREPGFGADLCRFKSMFYLIQAEDLKHLSGSLFPVKKVGPLTTQSMLLTQCRGSRGKWMLTWSLLASQPRPMGELQANDKTRLKGGK